MFKKGKLVVLSFNYCTSTTKERELYYLSCTSGIRKLKNKKTNTKIIGSDLSINVLKGHKPSFSCSAEKGNLPPKNYFCTNATDKILKTSHYLHERKNFSVADLLSPSLFQEQLRLNHVKETITSASSSCNIDR